ncbi:hypothetical protein ACFE04_016232 [Oxalis oulophora]
MNIRKKVKLEFINKDSSRIACYKKRSKNIMKKTKELSTLCGVDACAIIYSPYASGPMVWPSLDGAKHVVSRFNDTPKKNQNDEKLMAQLEKTKKKIREKELTIFMFRALAGDILEENFSLNDLNYLGFMCDKKLKEINERLDAFTINNDVVIVIEWLVDFTTILRLKQPINLRRALSFDDDESPEIEVDQSESDLGETVVDGF